MATNPSDFAQTQYLDVPFTPSPATKLREAMAAKANGTSMPFADDSAPNYFARSIAGGLVGGLIGALCYAAFVGLTGISIGYLAILVGFLVGKGMTLASDDRGGQEYQFTAVALTYLAVGAAHSGLLWWAARLSGRAYPGLALGMVKYALLFPILKFGYSPRNGVIGLIILFVGMRAAWRMTSDNPGTRRSPFKR